MTFDDLKTYAAEHLADIDANLHAYVDNFLAFVEGKLSREPPAAVAEPEPEPPVAAPEPAPVEAATPTPAAEGALHAE